jgi:hypothetical protein
MGRKSLVRKSQKCSRLELPVLCGAPAPLPPRHPVQAVSLAALQLRVNQATVQWRAESVSGVIRLRINSFCARILVQLLASILADPSERYSSPEDSNFF